VTFEPPLIRRYGNGCGVRARYVPTHNVGIVDQRYLNEFTTSPLKIGQPLTVSEAFYREAITDTKQYVGAGEWPVGHT